MSDKILVRIDYAKLAQYLESMSGSIRMFRVSKKMRNIDIMEALIRKIYAAVDTLEDTKDETAIS